MIRKLLILSSFVLLFSASLQAQEISSRKHINKVHKSYVEKLELNSSQSKDFKAILKKFNPILKELLDKDSKNNAINKQIKLMDVEVYKILDQQQFAKYKKIKVELESFKRYRRSS